MALSPNGVWYPTWGDEPVGTGVGGRLRTGSGVPDDGLGNNGDIYVNTTNGDIYTKSGDVWTIVSSGSGVVVQTIFSALEPNPNGGGIVPDDPTKPAIYYYDDEAGTTGLWIWSVTPQQWFQFLG